MSNFDELHQRITREIIEEREKEMAEFVAAKNDANKAAAAKEAKALEQVKAAKIDIAKLTTFDRSLEADAEKKLQAIREKYTADASEPSLLRPEDQRASSLNASYLPDGARSLTPSFAGLFASVDTEDELSGGTNPTIYNYSVIDAWCWAKGSGSGLFGSGAGSYQVWADWGFWFRPETNKYYSISPLNRFRGFYIVRADDGFWTSKRARAQVSIWTNVWQYNWKGWDHVTVLDVNDDNINVNKRFDTDRHTYYTALLGGGDWAYIRVSVRLYVYARGSGSYSELNFATGSANYLMAPHVHIY